MHAPSLPRRFGALALFVVSTFTTWAGADPPPSMVRRPPSIYPTCTSGLTATALSAACDPLVTSCAPAPGTGSDLVIDGGGVGGPRAVVLGGIARYNNVTVRNCGRLYIRPYTGNRATSGILQLIAQHVTVDATSAIVGDGAGYLPDLCRDGDGPPLTTAPPTMAGDPTGGRGGCRVSDSAGGGGHFGAGGRGTTDCNVGTGCLFPGNWEQACPGALPGYSTPSMEVSPMSCPSYTGCRTGTGTLSNAGPSYFHNIYTLEMGAAGGDAGCRDGDGFEAGHYTATGGHGVGGFGGGSLAIVGLAADTTGSVTINGYVVTRGGRGCAWDNDSGGGGAGGTILLVGDTVTVGATGVISAEGGPGGSGVSTGGGNQWWNACGTSNSTICDDCGGGGGGGIINVQSRSSSLSTSAFFLANGGPGGGNFDGCTVCQGEAGGGAGEIQLDGAYVGEVCDSYDNNFDGATDESLGTTTCGLGTCATTTPACVTGAPPTCTPTVTTDPSCSGSRGTSRPRVAVILDSSASMLWTLGGTPTFGDGSVDHPGIDLNGDGMANDSRMFAAKDALAQVISAYPEIDFAFARYHQDEGVNRSCPSAKWLECESDCCSFDNPRNEVTSGPLACQMVLTATPANVTVNIHDDSPASNRCINYAGTCGSPRRGADILVGFESDVRSYTRWLDGVESNFSPSAIPGNYCNGLAGDCEIRPSGPTPLAGSLQTVFDYVHPIQLEDPAASCRGYSVILISDGGEDCGGDPSAAAAALLAAGIRTYVIGVSVDTAEGTILNGIASSGGTTSFIPVNSAAQLLPALVSIVSGSIRHEVCNGVDDNCNGLIDEGFNVGAACDNGRAGICHATGRLACDPTDSTRTICQLSPPAMTATAEVCNGLDDNCDGRVDEGDPGGGGPCGSSVGACQPGVLHCQGGTLVCVGAIGPSPEACDGIDNDCNGMIDDGVPAGGPCGSSVGECHPGVFQCQGAAGYVCVGTRGGTPEVCDGLDNDCNGVVDDNVPGTGVPCASDSTGHAYCHGGIVRCVSGALHCQGAVPFHAPSCTCNVDPCATPVADGSTSSGCPVGSACLACACRTPCASGEFPCSTGLECRDNYCVPPLCGSRICADTEVCQNNTCVDRCATITCRSGQTCTQGRCVENNCYGLGCPPAQVCLNATCQTDPCAGVTCASDQFCRAGRCVATCENVYCPTGQSCHAGSCTSDPCAGFMCGAGQTCITSGASLDGGTPGDASTGTAHCVADPCINVGCGTGRVCNAGMCVDDPCLHVTCPGDPSQVVCRHGECDSVVAPPAPGAHHRVVATGGGGVAPGCAVAPGRVGETSSASFGWTLFGAAGVAWIARRRRRAGGGAR